MSIQVKSIDVYGIEARLRKSGDKETLQYIKALKEALERQRQLTNDCLKTIREYAKETTSTTGSISNTTNDE